MLASAPEVAIVLLSKKTTPVADSRWAFLIAICFPGFSVDHTSTLVSREEDAT